MKKSHSNNDDDDDNDDSKNDDRDDDNKDNKETKKRWKQSEKIRQSEMIRKRIETIRKYPEKFKRLWMPRVNIVTEMLATGLPPLEGMASVLDSKSFS